MPRLRLLTSALLYRLLRNLRRFIVTDVRVLSAVTSISDFIQQHRNTLAVGSIPDAQC